MKPEADGSRLLVTGASGFVGSAVAREARTQGLPVRATARRPPTGDMLDYVAADLAASSLPDSLWKGVTDLVHCAGLAHRTSGVAEEDFHRAHVETTARVLRSAVSAGVRRAVIVSSVAVYGPQGRPLVDESCSPRPDGAYGRSKLLAEEEAVRIAQEAGVGLAILRLATVYGEGDPGNVLRLVRALDRGRFVWIGDGSNRKTLIHVDDAARACIEALRLVGPAPAVYNVADAPCTMRDVVTEAARALQRKVPRWRIPAGPAMAGVRLASRLPIVGVPVSRARTTLEKWLSDEAYTANRFRTAAGFQTRVALSEGMRREVHWYRSCAS